MSRFGNGSNSNGQFWYGSNVNFPGFLYKKNVGVGTRRCTKFTPGGNTTCNTYQYLYNKYNPGQGGIGAQTTANRRAKNRYSTICANKKCFPCYMSLGQYSNYTHNPNGFYNCLNPKLSLSLPLTSCYYYQLDAYFATFRGNTPNFYGRSSFNGPSTLNIKYTSSGAGNDDISGSSPVIDKNGLIYVCSGITTTNYGLFCYYPDCSLKWYFSSGDLNTSYSIPVISCDGTIYFTGDVNVNNYNSSLYAINPDGTQKWVVSTLQGRTNDTYPLIVNNLNIFVSTSTGYVYIINNQGNIINSIYFGNINFNGWNSSYDIDTNSVFINGNFFLFKIDMTTYTYIYVSTGINGLYSVPVVIGNYVYQPGVVSGSVGIVQKYNKNDLTYINSSSNYNSMNDNSIIVDKNENIYIGDGGGNFIKLDKNLNEIWLFSVSGEDFNAGSATLSNNGYIYLNGYNNTTIYCLNTNGIQISSSIYPGSGGYGSPAIGSNELLYFNTSQGLIAYGN
jgi:hypothetical protein